jgi:hypothetical protein
MPDDPSYPYQMTQRVYRAGLRIYATQNQNWLKTAQQKNKSNTVELLKSRIDPDYLCTPEKFERYVGLFIEHIIPGADEKEKVDELRRILKLPPYPYTKIILQRSLQTESNLLPQEYLDTLSNLALIEYTIGRVRGKEIVNAFTFDPSPHEFNHCLEKNLFRLCDDLARKLTYTNPVRSGNDTIATDLYEWTSLTINTQSSTLKLRFPGIDTEYTLHRIRPTDLNYRSIDASLQQAPSMFIGPSPDPHVNQQIWSLTEYKRKHKKEHNKLIDSE